MSAAEHRKPCELRGSRTVLGARGGESPPRDSPKLTLHLRFKNKRERQLRRPRSISVISSDEGRYACSYCAASEDETLLKVALSCVPRPLTTALIATEMPAAIMPYSMAVAPDSFFRNATNLDIGGSSRWVGHVKKVLFGL